MGVACAPAYSPVYFGHARVSQKNTDPVHVVEALASSHHDVDSVSDRWENSSGSYWPIPAAAAAGLRSWPRRAFRRPRHTAPRTRRRAADGTADAEPRYESDATALTLRRAAMSEGDAEAARIAWVKRAVCDGLNLEEGLRGRVAQPER